MIAAKTLSHLFSALSPGGKLYLLAKVSEKNNFSPISYRMIRHYAIMNVPVMHCQLSPYESGDAGTDNIYEFSLS